MMKDRNQEPDEDTCRFGMRKEPRASMPSPGVSLTPVSMSPIWELPKPSPFGLLWRLHFLVMIG